jgi:hypothetical protein
VKGLARARWKPTTAVRIALATGLLTIVVALVVVLSGSPLAVAGTDGIPANQIAEFLPGNATNCQSGGTLPQGTTAIRLSFSANIGPWVNVEALSGSTVVTEGRRAAGWGIDETVTVPVRRVSRTVDNVRICTTTGPVVEPLQVNGVVVKTPGTNTIFMRTEYLRPRSASWLSLAPSVARDMGLAHAPGGTWVAYAVIAVMLAVVAIASRMVLRELA